MQEKSRTGKHGMKPDVLTNREIEIVKEIATGKTSKEIAQRLYISPFTVSKHRENVLRKLQLHNAAQLTAYAIKYDLVRGGLRRRRTLPGMAGSHGAAGT
jgi:DNA-binding CsgD family transcriptional regulator